MPPFLMPPFLICFSVHSREKIANKPGIVEGRKSKGFVCPLEKRFLVLKMIKKLRNDTAPKAPDSPKRNQPPAERRVVVREAETTSRPNPTPTSSTSPTPPKSYSASRKRHNSKPSAEHKMLNATTANENKTDTQKAEVSESEQNEENTSEICQNQNETEKDNSTRCRTEDEDLKRTNKVNSLIISYMMNQTTA